MIKKLLSELSYILVGYTKTAKTPLQELLKGFLLFKEFQKVRKNLFVFHAASIGLCCFYLDVFAV